MGNSGSSNNNSASHQQQQCPSVNQEMGRGWTHSFPRELTRHHSQPPGHKVLPEPPNQRLRATNNGSIIHNGGTISGRRPSALTLPHDLNKGVYRSRSTSASNLGPRSRSNDQNHSHCCLCRSADNRCRDHEMTELKRFGSEPDLRYSPNEHSRHNNHHNQHYQHHPQSNNQENRHSSHYPERESRERESRYRGKKKYKAPAPPGNADGSSPDSYKWEIGQQQERENFCRPENEMIQPPPRRSRLFKTRAETKKAQTNWQSSAQDSDCLMDNERRWRNDRGARENNRCAWRDNSEREVWSRDEKRGSKKYDGKNTLQRSLSSPEFQAELMQVARKLRNKLNYNRRIGPIGAATIISSSIVPESKNDSTQKKSKSSNDYAHREERKKFSSRPEDSRDDDRRAEKRKPQSLEDNQTFDVRGENLRSSARFHADRTSQSRGNRETRTLKEIRVYENGRDDNNSRDFMITREKNDELALDNNGNRRRVVEKSYKYEERIISSGTKELVNDRKLHNERLEPMDNTLDERLVGVDGRHRRDNEMKNRHEINERTRERKFDDFADSPRTRSESPSMRVCRDRTDVRGQGSGRESTPEPPRGREKKLDHRKRRIETKDDNFVLSEKRWSSDNARRNGEKNLDSKILEKKSAKQQQETKESRGKNWNGLPPNGKTAPKTYYFSVDDGLSREIRTNEDIQQLENAQTRLQVRDSNNTSSNTQNRTDDSKNQNGMDDIALKLRPTLPKKQLEIPRFSPSAAWRLLSALETPGPTMSTASEELPVMFEERIERLARPPPPLVALGPRSSHDKSGDSGISGDAGGANDDSLDVSTTNRNKTPATTRPAWTPQQDLGEESSSDAGVDSPPPMPPSVKFPPRPHVFSLSLPRDDNRLYPADSKMSKENSSFNSLQKLKRSVTGALGLVTADIDDRKRPSESLGENWLLSTSAPNSLQHNKANNNNTDNGETFSPLWENNYSPENENDDDEIEDIEENEDKTDFPVIMKPPSFSYLASGGHVIYLPESNDTEHRTQSLNYRNSSHEIGNLANTKYRKNIEDPRLPNKIGSFGINGISITGGGGEREMGIYRERSFTDLGPKSRKYPNFFKSCENIAEMRQRSVSPVNAGPENLQDSKGNQSNVKITTKNQKTKRFTFQSTVRQIERRRLAEKLSREAEAKERQRKSELEVMRKVEEEFQRKRAREKANIRQQLRLYSMDENSSSLPPAWDSSQLSRADPDGAPSSSASSPTSAPPGKMANRQNSIGSDEYQHRKRVSESRAQQQQQQQQQPVQQREYKDYRPKYYDWSPDSSSHLDVKQTTVHPKVVYDIPKSSHVFVDTNLHTAKPANVTSTPRSDNYRKDFAHGAVAAKTSLASSDSELSQPNTRPHSRQNGNKSKPLRSRSASPARSEGAGSPSAESPVEAIKQDRNSSVNGFILNGVQPFVREKSYRPIAFNPRPPPPIPS